MNENRKTRPLASALAHEKDGSEGSFHGLLRAAMLPVRSRKPECLYASEAASESAGRVPIRHADPSCIAPDPSTGLAYRVNERCTTLHALTAKSDLFETRRDPTLQEFLGFFTS